MAGCPRGDIIDDNEVGTYHCFNRCVRREFLLGNNRQARKDYEYRKDWLRALLIEMAGIFSIDIFKYAVLDNHFHLILRNRPDLAKRWSERKVLRRALQLFPEKFRRLGLFVEPHEPLPKKLLSDKCLIEEMRKRLASISWLMKVVQERIARRANREDDVTGAFWAGRFQSKALLDSAAVLSCAMYIDLNPERAGKTTAPEQTKYTSAYDRINGLRARDKNRRAEGIAHDGWLCALSTRGDYPDEDLAEAGKRASNDGLLELPLTVYLKMLDCVCNQLQRGSGELEDSEFVPILERIGIQSSTLIECIQYFGRTWRRAVGGCESMRKQAERVGQEWLQGSSSAKRYFTTPAA